MTLSRLVQKNISANIRDQLGRSLVVRAENKHTRLLDRIVVVVFPECREGAGIPIVLDFIPSAADPNSHIAGLVAIDKNSSTLARRNRTTS